jgi:hypothetical protein
MVSAIYSALVYTIGNGVERDLGKKRTSEQTQIDNMHTCTREITCRPEAN